VERDGVSEIQSGKFAEKTKEREGVIPTKAPEHVHASLGANGGKAIN